jgi:hypothetical protein
MSTTTENKKPTHAIWQVQGEGEKQRWNRIGAAWMHKDAKGARLIFDSFPLSGRIVLREITNDNAAGNEGGAE